MLFRSGVVASGDEWRGRTDGRRVYPGYFQTMGIRLLKGRYFQPGDPDYDSVLTGNVAIINQTLVQRLWPDDDPIGKRISFSRFGPRWMTVVGVVEDTEDSSLRDRTRDDLALRSLTAAAATAFGTSLSAFCAAVARSGDLD